MSELLTLKAMIRAEKPKFAAICALGQCCCPVLDKPCGIVNPEVPQTSRGVAVALPLPHREQKNGFFYSCHLRTPEGYGYISARRRPVSVRTGGLYWTGERRLAFFVPINQPQNQ